MTSVQREKTQYQGWTVGTSLRIGFESSNKNYRTIWLSESDDRIVRIINQLALPHCFETVDLECVEEAVSAIKEMQVRGA